MNSMDFETVKTKVIQLAHINPDIELLWLYGSHAKLTAHDNSDIDLAVAFKCWEQDILERRLRPELLALDWQIEFNLNEGQLSILDINQAPIPLAMSVLQSGQLLMSKNPSRHWQERQRIQSRWEIDYLYHYQHQQALYG
ncbi:MAG: hypothetical protein RL563_1317 [Pseudomonadota bacterium]